MNKLSNAQIAEVLTDAASTIRKLAEEKKTLSEKIASMELEQRVTKLASTMHSKGLRLDVDKEDLVEELQKAASSGRLETMEQAVEMVGPDMGKFAQLTNDDREASGSSDLERFIVGGVG